MPRRVCRSVSCRRGSRFLLLFGALSLGGCSPEPPVFEAVYRFADLDSLSRTETNIPAPRKPDASDGDQSFQIVATNVATIRNDSRLVLAAPPYALVAHASKFEVAADGIVDMVRVLPPALQGAAEILVLPIVKLPAVLPGVSPVLGKTEPVTGSPGVRMQLQLPEAVRGKTVELNLFGLALTWPNVTRTRTPVVRIPPNARLEAAIGVLNPANIATSVGFVIKACEAEDCRPVFEEKFASDFGLGDVPWRTVKADLASYANRDVSFEFETETVANGPSSRLFPLWANPTVFAPRAGDAPGVATNVVLISAHECLRIPAQYDSRDGRVVRGRRRGIRELHVDGDGHSAVAHDDVHGALPSRAQRHERHEDGRSRHRSDHRQDTRRRDGDHGLHRRWLAEHPAWLRRGIQHLFRGPQS